jgi:adenine-specific DNA-methyltransferase
MEVFDKPASLADLSGDGPEQLYAARVDYATRRAIGQVFTPMVIANAMARWIAGARSITRVADPAVGLGVFFRALKETDAARDWSLVGTDIDPGVLSHASELFAGDPAVQLRQGDSLRDYWEERYDGVICNPPYLKFHDFPDRASVIADFNKRLGSDLSGLSNIHVLFLLKSIGQLTDGGRYAYIMPSEFLNTSYGVEVKKQLLASGTLRFVLAFSHDSSVFDEALTTALVLLGEKSAVSDEVHFATVEGTAQLMKISEHLGARPFPKLPGFRSIPVAELDPCRKWRRYYGDEEAEYEGLVPFSVMARVKRGIATGANGFFSLRPSEAKAQGLPPEVLLPCLTKANQCKGNLFGSKEFEALVEEDASVYLVDAGRALDDPTVQRLVKRGEAEGIDQRYLTKSRSPWFALEQREPAPVLMSVFSRGGVRVVRNEASVRNLTCFHGVYPTEEWSCDVSAIMAYLMTPTALDLLYREKRDYGGGLDKFEPNDLNNASVIDLRARGPQLLRLLSDAWGEMAGRTTSQTAEIVAQIDAELRLTL